MYTFPIHSGTLSLRPPRAGNSGCELWLNEQILTRYESASVAAQAIASQLTGTAAIDHDEALTERIAELEAWDWNSVTQPEAR